MRGNETRKNKGGITEHEKNYESNRADRKIKQRENICT